MNYQDLSNEELGGMIRWAINEMYDFIDSAGDCNIHDLTYLENEDIKRLHKAYTKYNNRFIPTDADSGKMVRFELKGEETTGMLMGVDDGSDVLRYCVKYKTTETTYGWIYTWIAEAKLVEERK